MTTDIKPEVSEEVECDLCAPLLLKDCRHGTFGSRMTQR